MISYSGNLWPFRDNATSGSSGSSNSGLSVDEMRQGWTINPSGQRVSPSGSISVKGAPAGTSAGTFDATKQPYQLGGEQKADVNLQGKMNTVSLGNPFQTTAQGAANSAGSMAAGQGRSAADQAASMYGGANAVMATSFDPQNALYDRTAQQLQDQIRVGQAARGITNSPYGAGLENSAMSNFNIDWQNNQLGRQVQGLGAAGQGNTVGFNLGSGAVDQTMASGQLPYSVGQQGLANDQQSIQNYLAYLNHGTQASAGNSMPVQRMPQIINNQQPQYLGW